MNYSCRSRSDDGSIVPAQIDCLSVDGGEEGNEFRAGDVLKNEGASNTVESVLDIDVSQVKLRTHELWVSELNSAPQRPT